MMRSMPENELRLYEDVECQIPAKDIDLGRLEVGTKTEIVRFLKNHSDKWPFQNIKLSQADPEITAVLPEILAPKAVMSVKFVFNPSLSRREPLDVDNLVTGELYVG